jgi:enamine deaminase RidA (YjgF/YER057c/UK114 family)
MPVHLIRSSDPGSGLTDDVPYAYAAVVDGGDLVLTAGACPLDDAGDVVPVGDLAGQAARVMDNLAAALAGAGSSLDQVAKTTVYVATADRADLVTAWNVVRAAFGDHDAPSTLLAVPVLGYPDQLVEVEAVAVRPRSEDY